MKNLHSIGKLGIAMVFSLLAGPLWAQPPAGFEAYLGMKDQFDRVADRLERLRSGFGCRRGARKGGPPVVFSSEVIDGKAMAAGDREALRKVLSQMAGVEVGSIPGFMLDRLPARKGMSCSGFDKNAEKQLLDLLGKDAMFGKGRTTREKPHADSIPLGGCQGLRVRGKGTAGTGAGKTLDIFAASDGKVLFLFMLLNLDEHYGKNVGVFEQIISTVKFPRASSGAG